MFSEEAMGIGAKGLQMGGESGLKAMGPGTLRTPAAKELRGQRQVANRYQQGHRDWEAGK